MSINRRNFLNKLLGATGSLTVLPFFNTSSGQAVIQALEQEANTSAAQLATDDDFWRIIQQAYTISPTLINLNNGGVCPQPRIVVEALERYHHISNEAPSYYMWRILDKGREPLREKLADLGQCDAEEIAINRNATEALETVIFGLPLKQGDEIVLSKFDYPNMMNAWKQRAIRDGIVLKWVNFTFPLEDDDLIINSYLEQITPRTKLVHLTHLINWTGQVLPVAKIAAKIKEKRADIDIMVDGAHSFAHLQYSVAELNCDYFGTSLHKWLCAPFGTGMLYVKKSKIAGVFPLFGAPDPLSDDIRKFEHLGTRSFAIEQAIGQAIEFHHLIGSDRKEKRLQYLKNYWLEQVLQLPKVYSYTSTQAEYSGAIATVAIEGNKPASLSNFLFNKYRIHTVGMEWEGVAGVRITPNVYTTTRDLDILVAAFEQFCS